MAKRGRKRRRRRGGLEGKIAATETALREMLNAQLNRQIQERDALDRSIEMLTARIAVLTNGAVKEPSIIRRGRPPKAEANKRGPRGAKTARLLRIGEQIYDIMHKDKGTKFSTDALRSKLGADTPVGPAVKAWSKANPEKSIAGSGPGRAKQYALKA